MFFQLRESGLLSWFPFTVQRVPSLKNHAFSPFFPEILGTAFSHLKLCPPLPECLACQCPKRISCAWGPERPAHKGLDELEPGPLPLAAYRKAVPRGAHGAHDQHAPRLASTAQCGVLFLFIIAIVRTSFHVIVLVLVLAVAVLLLLLLWFLLLLLLLLLLFLLFGSCSCGCGCGCGLCWCCCSFRCCCAIQVGLAPSPSAACLERSPGPQSLALLKPQPVGRPLWCLGRKSRSSSGEVRLWVPFFSVVYFSRGTLPQQKKR